MLKNDYFLYQLSLNTDQLSYWTSEMMIVKSILNAALLVDLQSTHRSIDYCWSGVVILQEYVWTGICNDRIIEKNVWRNFIQVFKKCLPIGCTEHRFETFVHAFCIVECLDDRFHWIRQILFISQDKERFVLQILVTEHPMVESAVEWAKCRASTFVHDWYPHQMRASLE